MGKVFTNIPGGRFYRDSDMARTAKFFLADDVNFITDSINFGK